MVPSPYSYVVTIGVLLSLLYAWFTLSDIFARRDPIC
jgi:hypothetical protein